jgi:hypothetical protein
MPWWGLVLVGLGLIAMGILAFLAYSYWGWERRTGSMAIVSPPVGVAVIVWGLVRGLRAAVARRSTRDT